jgi:hypothetical protein
MANTLKSLTFAPLPKLSASDPVVQRRIKLITRIQQQIALANDPNYTITSQKWVQGENGKELKEQHKRVRPWWITELATGNVLLTIRYGAAPVFFEKGKAAIVVGKKDRLLPTLEAVAQAVQAGELDAALTELKGAVQPKSRKAA